MAAISLTVNGKAATVEAEPDTPLLWANGVAAMIYPTSLRANGSGWQLGIGRFGSIVGPLAGAVLIGIPVERLYLWGTLPFLAAAIVCFIVHRLNTARLAARPELRDAQ